MKTMILGFLALLCAGAAWGDESNAPLGKLVVPYPWTEVHTKLEPGIQDGRFYFNDPGPQAHVEWAKMADEPGHFELKVTYSGSAPYTMQLLNLSETLVSRIHTRHYAYVGEVSYENAPAGSYLEMWSYFGSPFPRNYPEAGAYFTRALADSGPMGKLEGTHGWREFWLPFDSTGATSALKNLVLNLHLSGPGTVSIRKIRLVEYPDGPQSSATPARAPVGSIALPGAIAELEGIDWRSFLLGAGITGLVALCMAGMVFLLQRKQRKEHERELRRIASLDS